MNQIILILSTLFFCSTTLCAQQGQVPADPDQEKYEWRLRQEVLYDVYIPKDVNEVFMELNKKIDAQSKAKFLTLGEEEATTRLFFSLGRWMTHNWSLFEGSRLSKYMQDMGIHHPDNMVRFLITAYHRSLGKQPLEIKELIKKYQEMEEKEKQERQHKGTILHEEKKKMDKPSDGKSGQR
ncbi:MAG: hypothetical protein HY842_12070 [Bacteroidetes bacterium]|nr:hypothetical protein [Bacteroidota bacterium]